MGLDPPSRTVRLHSHFSSNIARLLKKAVPLLAIRDVDDLRSQQLIEQQVCRRLLWLIPSQYKDTLKSESSRRRRGSLATMIGLRRPGGNQGLGALVPCFGNDKFQFSSLVAAEGKPSLVVAFDEQTWSVQNLGKTRKNLNGGR